MLLSLALLGTLATPNAGTAQGAGAATLPRTGPQTALGAQVQAAIGGDTDWVIPTGQVFVFDTTSTLVNGKLALDGYVGVRNFHIEPGATLVVQGPNPFVMTASGTVRIEGLLDLSGTNAPGVNSLNTTSVPEMGAPGQVGGGGGGIGSPETTMSSAQGGPGAGAFGGLGGGFGGETGWSNLPTINERRGAGGGGGRFGFDVFDQSIIGLDAEPGFNNNEAANGALSGPGPAHGGDVGESPFTDADPNNDHYGLKLDRATGALIPGELKTPWAGAGGGGGGDASRVKAGEVFPSSNFLITGDEKGAGGAAGGGSLHLMAIGPIEIVGSGQIKARGGLGGGGENTIFLNRVGGGSGGGSGGHVVLETAAYIDLSGATSQALLATGGQGGAGKDDEGGAFRSNSGIKETTPQKDACPPGQVGCKGHVEGAGGDGSPGLIQLHVPRSDGVGSNVRLPAGVTLAELSFPLPVGAGTGGHMIPTFQSGQGQPVFKAAARRLSADELRFKPGLGLGSLRD